MRRFDVGIATLRFVSELDGNGTHMTFAEKKTMADG